MEYLIRHNYGSRSFTTKAKRDDRFKKKITVIGGVSDPRLNRAKRSGGNKGNFFAKLQRTLTISFCIALMASSAYMSYANSKTPTATPAKAAVQQDEEPNSPVTNVDKVKGFTSADIPRGYNEADQANQNIEKLFQKYFGNDAKTMMAICKPENKYNVEPVGWKSAIIGDLKLVFAQDGKKYGMSVGLCQIRIMPTRGITIEQMQNPEHNIEYAKYLSDEAAKRGLDKFSPWTCYNNGSYKKYLEE